MLSLGHQALRPIAVFEALKGAVVLIAGFGLLSFLGRDGDVFAAHLVVVGRQLFSTSHSGYTSVMAVL